MLINSLRLLDNFIAVFDWEQGLVSFLNEMRG